MESLHLLVHIIKAYIILKKIIQSLTSNFVLIKHTEYFSILTKSINVNFKKQSNELFVFSMLQQDSFLIKICNKSLQFFKIIMYNYHVLCKIINFES